jgi:hypothetical protein
MTRRDDRQDAKDARRKTKISGESSLGVPGVLAVSLSDAAFSSPPDDGL